MGSCCPNRICNCMPYANCCHYEHRGVNRDSKLQARWMEVLHNVNPNIKLNHMTIPGTHDSATYSISDKKVLSSAAKTQRLSLYEQLNHGVRFLDIRYGGDGSGRIKGVKVMHGPFAGNTLIENVNQVKRFLDENPNEFIIARFKEERSKKISNLLRVQISEFILKTFLHLSVEDTDVYNFEEDEDYTKDGWFDLHNLTLNHILQSSRRILILGEIKMFKFVCKGYKPKSKKQRRKIRDTGGKVDDEEHTIRMYMRKKHFFLREDFFVNEWHNKNNAKTLLKSVYKNITDNKSFMLFNSQITLTLDHDDCCDFVKIACCLDPVRIDQHVRRLLYGRKLQHFFERHIDKKWNYCWFDYVDYDMDIVNMLIGRNFQVELEIIKAIYSTKKKVIIFSSKFFFVIFFKILILYF